MLSHLNQDDRRDAQVGRILNAFLDTPCADVRAEETALLKQHPDLARELKGQMAMIRRLRQVTRMGARH
jgi:2-oxo-4-hydroxy-4-carboxy--5-ureidoimidazoline (OHCU) decarboxylase